jgi:alanyl-tRNA synthetase
MKGREIRAKFLNYFQRLNHVVVPSSPLIPKDDPTLLFTNAGMVQFKKVFLGEEKRPYMRAVSCQKCVRAGGKHNDLENVGYTARHHTFFEMLGNFSFGDYFKEEAILYAWEFLTKELGLPKEKLYATVFYEDEEAVSLWKKIAGFSEDRIIRLGEKDNFWMMGDTGPCGPCSEIVYDQGPEFSCGKPDCQPGCDCDRFLEVWNLVFMQYERTKEGKLIPLPKPCIDTGMGLERITAVVQGVPTNFDTDLFAGLMQKISELSGRGYKENRDTEVAFRVIADHFRASAFIIAEGIIPSNEGRGYVLRRIIRRAERFGKLLGLNEPFLYKLLPPLIEEYGDLYPEIKENAPLIEKVLKHEEERFLETLNIGLEVLAEEVERLKEKGEKTIPAELLFKLYDTYGFPYDLVRDYVLPLGFSLDLEGFERLKEEARGKSRQTWKGALETLPPAIKELISQGVKTEFVGYEEFSTRAKVLALIDDILVVDKTPFYPEGGGQVADVGLVVGEKGKAQVVDAEKASDLILHRIKLLEGRIEVGDEVELTIDVERRRRIMRHHTATHLLHSALRQALGSHVRQYGSLVEEGRLRFDFTHFLALKPEELKKVEDLVNRWILENYEVETKWMPREEAEKLGALAFFEEKYGDIVRVVRIDDVSCELCGGTHVKRTGDIGIFKVISEGSVASGVRRITAICGDLAYQYVRDLEDRLERLASLLKTSPQDLEKRVEQLLKEMEDLKAELKRWKGGNLRDELARKLSSVVKVGEISLFVGFVPVEKMDELRECGDFIKQKLGSGVIFLASEKDGKIQAICMVTKDLSSKVSAKDIFLALSKKIGLKGGGRPELAQGTLLEKVDEESLKEKVYEAIEEVLRGG